MDGEGAASRRGFLRRGRRCGLRRRVHLDDDAALLDEVLRDGGLDLGGGHGEIAFELGSEPARVAPIELEFAELDRATQRRFETEDEPGSDATLHALELGGAHRSLGESVELGVESALDLGDLGFFREHDVDAELIRSAEVARPGARLLAECAFSHQRLVEARALAVAEQRRGELESVVLGRPRRGDEVAVKDTGRFCVRVRERFTRSCRRPAGPRAR